MHWAFHTPVITSTRVFDVTDKLETILYLLSIQKMLTYTQHTRE